MIRWNLWHHPITTLDIVEGCILQTKESFSTKEPSFQEISPYSSPPPPPRRSSFSLTLTSRQPIIPIESAMAQKLTAFAYAKYSNSLGLVNWSLRPVWCMPWLHCWQMRCVVIFLVWQNRYALCLCLSSWVVGLSQIILAFFSAHWGHMHPQNGAFLCNIFSLGSKYEALKLPYILLTKFTTGINDG